MFLETIQSSVNVGDYIKFSQSGSAPNSINNVGYGEIIEHLNDIDTVKLFKVVPIMCFVLDIKFLLMADCIASPLCCISLDT